MRPRRTETLCIALVLAVSPGISAQTAQREGAEFLLLPVGAQGVSLGRAMTWVEGPEGAFWNPAGLAGVEKSQAVVFRGDHFVGTATALSTLWRSSVGTLGASYFLLDAGELQRRDDLGNPTGYNTIRNHLGVVSGATELFDGVAIGLNFKVVRFQASCRGICPDEGSTATTYAIDAGMQLSPSERLRLGVMVAHLGPRLQVKNAEQADPLPARVRVAVAYDLLDLVTDDTQLEGWLALEVEDRPRELGSTAFYLGAEVVAGTADQLALRTGYVWSDIENQDGVRVGLGLTYERFDLSIAKSLAIAPLTGETEPIQVTFSIGF